MSNDSSIFYWSHSITQRFYMSLSSMESDTFAFSMLDRCITRKQGCWNPRTVDCPY